MNVVPFNKFYSDFILKQSKYHNFELLLTNTVGSFDLVMTSNANFDAGPILQLFYNCFVFEQSTTSQQSKIPKMGLHLSLHRKSFYGNYFIKIILVIWWKWVTNVRIGYASDGTCMKYIVPLHPMIFEGVFFGGGPLLQWRHKKFFCGGHRGVKMCIWRGKNQKICQKWLILTIFSSDGG